MRRQSDNAVAAAPLDPSAPYPDDERRVPGEPGIWVVILGDVFVFVVLFGLFLHYAGEQPDVFAEGQSHLSPGFGFLNTMWLLASSLAVVVGVNATVQQRHRIADRALLVGIGFGLLFVVTKTVEWTLKVDAGFVPNTNDFFMLYFVIAGLHLLHVFIGLYVLVLMRRVVRRGADRPFDRAMVQSGAAFWHMVDLIWLILFPLIYFVH